MPHLKTSFFLVYIMFKAQYLMEQAWELLGDLSKEGAMAGFVSLLDRVCPPFKDFVDAHVLKDQLEREEDRRRQHQQQRLQHQPAVDLQRFEQQR
uniref:Uncharacterized protein n=1 Tax=Plectus sambesii TaxID=2011161 RepID=A0A914WHR5_9BILA